MAAEDEPNPPQPDGPQADVALEPVESSGDEDDSSSEEDLIEPLYAGRERRANQGNRYSSLLQQEKQANEDDEISALFQEDEELDEEFPGSEAEVEAEPDEDSSDTDNEDQGPTAGAEELDGEKQLEKEERAAKKAQKRKADKIITKPAPIRKKVKIDESVSTPKLEDRKRKRPERTSWVPTIEPVRTSSRTLAVQNKERTTASLKESAARREQAIALQQAAKKRKDAVKVKPKTQADRLAEAAATEAINSQSLNTWQEKEEDRLRRQKAHLEAMHNRKIKGPFIRWKSSRAQWQEGKVTMLGRDTKIQVVEETQLKKLPKAVASVDAMSITPTTHQSTPVPITSAEGSAPGSDQKTAAGATDHADSVIQSHQSILQGPPKDGFATLMEEMEAYAAKDQTEQDVPTDIPIPPPLGDQQPLPQPEQPTHPPDPISSSINATKPPMPADPIQTGPSTETPPHSASALLSQFQTHPPSDTTTTLAILEPPTSPEKSFSTRNALTLHNYFAPTIAHPSIERHILFNTPLPASLPSSKSLSARASVGRPKAATAAEQAPPKPVTALCAVTGQPARYRDPLTGLPYLNREAFAGIRRAVRGECVWSGVLGAWVGRAGEGARGVPVGFVGGDVDGGGGKVEGLERTNAQ